MKTKIKTVLSNKEFEYQQKYPEATKMDNFKDWKILCQFTEYLTDQRDINIDESDVFKFAEINEKAYHKEVDEMLKSYPISN